MRSSKPVKFIQNYFPYPFVRLIWFFNSLTANPSSVRHANFAKYAAPAAAFNDRLLDERELTIEILMRPF